jgi:membrane protein DedA with SNARE-associated domain
LGTDRLHPNLCDRHGAVLFRRDPQLAGGALFGPVWGTAWNLAGATLGATAAFLLARSIAGEWAARRIGGRLRRLIDGVTEEGWRFVALMRLVPLIPFNLLNYAFGLTGISLPVYVLTSALCMLPGAVAYTWLGYAGRSVAAGDLGALRYGLLGLGGLAMIAFLPRLFRRFRARDPAWIEADELQRRLAAGDGPTQTADRRGLQNRPALGAGSSRPVGCRSPGCRRSPWWHGRLASARAGAGLIAKQARYAIASTWSRSVSTGQTSE